MVRYASNLDRKTRVRKNLHRVAGFKIILAGAGFAGKLPRWNLIVHERIIERFGDFMAERGHVLESAEDAGRDPAGIGKYPARLLWNSGVSKERMESQGAAISHTAFSIEREEERIGEQGDVQ